MSKRRRGDVWLCASEKQGLDGNSTTLHTQGFRMLYPRYQATHITYVGRLTNKMCVNKQQTSVCLPTHPVG